MRSFKRSQRVADQIKRDASKIIADMLRDNPRFLITVSDVEISDDLRNARVFYTVLSKDAGLIDEVRELMKKRAKKIQSEIARRLNIRRVPEITLHYDKSLVEGMRMTSLIDQVMSKKNDGRND